MINFGLKMGGIKQKGLVPASNIAKLLFQYGLFLLFSSKTLRNLAIILIEFLDLALQFSRPFLLGLNIKLEFLNGLFVDIFILPGQGLSFKLQLPLAAFDLSLDLVFLFDSFLLLCLFHLQYLSLLFLM